MKELKYRNHTIQVDDQDAKLIQGYIDNHQLFVRSDTLTVMLKIRSYTITLARHLLELDENHIIKSYKDGRHTNITRENLVITREPTYNVSTRNISHRGVSFHKFLSKPWRVRIVKLRNRVVEQFFLTEDEAVAYYNKVIRSYHPNKKLIDT